MKNIKLVILFLFVSTLFISCTNQNKKDLFEDAEKYSTIHKVLTFYNESEEKGFLLFLGGKNGKTLTTKSYGFGGEFSDCDDTLFLEFKDGSKTVLLNQSAEMRDYVDKTYPGFEKLIKNSGGYSIFGYFLDGNNIENNPILLKKVLKRITLKRGISNEMMSIEVDSSQEKFFINYF